MFIFYLKKRNIHHRHTEKNIQLLRYSGKKCCPIYKNIYICRYIYINLAVGIIVCRWRREDCKSYQALIACAIFVCR